MPYTSCHFLLSLIRSFLLGFLLSLSFTLIGTKLDYAFVVWDSLTCTDSKKLERFQGNISTFYYNIFLNKNHIY
jgi:hypothetical protein